ncbi:MAG: hypothetical protein IIB88_10205, partial [Chloroflexi bacterium]|nr:hypothetical protein [Chloroflexota bacterium]
VDADTIVGTDTPAMLIDEHDLTNIEFKTLRTDGLLDEERAVMFGLFDSCYRQANHAYLEDTIERLGFASLALHGDTLVGFGLAELRIMDLPCLPQATVVLGGLTCVAAEFRRQGLGTELGHRNIVASARGAHERMLLCGRAAHPAGFRIFLRNESVVPQRGVTPSPWQQEIGQVIADAYGVAAFDPLTFACTGSGTPIGYPMMEMDVEPEEWELFRPVDRDCGDSLLGMVWIPDAPPGW